MTAATRAWALSATAVDLTSESDRPRRVTFEALPQRLTLDLERTAIVVIDMQNDFCTPGGWLSSIGVDVSVLELAVTGLQRTLPELRALGVPVVWVNWGNRPDRANLPPGVTHVYDTDGSGGGIGERAGASEAVLTAGSWGAALVDGLAPAPSDVFVDKFRMGGFFETPLDSILRGRRIDTVLFAGVNADQCVLATLIEAASLGYDVVLVEDATATTSPQYCLDATLYNVRQCFGFTTTTDSLLAGLVASRSTAG